VLTSSTDYSFQHDNFQRMQRTQVISEESNMRGIGEYVAGWT